MVLDSSSSQRYKLQDLRKPASSSPCSSSGDRTTVSHCPRLFLLFMLYVQLHPTDVSPSEAEVLEATRLRIREADVLGPRLPQLWSTLSSHSYPAGAQNACGRATKFYLLTQRHFGRSAYLQGRPGLGHRGISHSTQVPGEWESWGWLWNQEQTGAWRN